MDLESPLAEAGSMQECPFCHTGFYSPGVDEKAAEDRQNALEQLAKENAALARRQEKEQQREVVVARPVAPPPQLVWYGAMFCHACGYQWKARRQTPPAKCAGCGSRRIEPIREPVRNAGCAAVLILFIVAGWSLWLILK